MYNKIFIVVFQQMKNVIQRSMANGAAEESY